jgi:transcriptional regulator with XRE-family HTH domain
VVVDDTVLGIGQRVRRARRYRGMTLATAAGLAGISTSYLSMIENGRRRLDSRTLIGTLADVLAVSVVDLTGQPYAPTDREQSDAQAAVPSLRLALMQTALDGVPDVVPRPLPELLAETRRIGDLRWTCDYAAVGAVMPRLLRELHAAVRDPSVRAEASRALVMVCQAGATMLKDLGYPDLAWIMADRGCQVAEQLGDALWVAASRFPRAHALLAAGATTQALSQVDDAAALVTPDAAEAGQVYGMLQLSAAMALTQLHRADDALTRIAEADEVAARTGDGTAFRFCFGPTNVRLWQVALAVEEGEGGRAAVIARTVDVGAIPARSRQAAFYADVGRGLAQVRGRSREAVTMIRRAEELAPQRIRVHPLVRETVRDLLGQSRRAAGGPELRGLARRMAVLPE